VYADSNFNKNGIRFVLKIHLIHAVRFQLFQWGVLWLVKSRILTIPDMTAGGYLHFNYTYILHFFFYSKLKILKNN